jgi:hypothetical protein
VSSLQSLRYPPPKAETCSVSWLYTQEVSSIVTIYHINYYSLPTTDYSGDCIQYRSRTSQPNVNEVWHGLLIHRLRQRRKRRRKMQRHNVQLSHCSTRHSGGGSGVLVHLRRPKGLHQVEVTASPVREKRQAPASICRFWQRTYNKRHWTACFRSHRLATLNVDVDVTDCLSWSTICSNTGINQAVGVLRCQ